MAHKLHQRKHAPITKRSATTEYVLLTRLYYIEIVLHYTPEKATLDN